MFQTRPRRPLSLLDRSVVISIAAMAAMNLLVLSQQTQAAPVRALTLTAAAATDVA